MNYVKALIRRLLDLTYVGSEMRIVGSAVHPAILGSVGLVLLMLVGISVNGLTMILATASLYAVEGLLDEYSNS